MLGLFNSLFNSIHIYTNVYIFILLIPPLFIIIFVSSKVLFPNIVPYEQPPPRQKSQKSACYAGSFNPPHLGHLDILRRLSEAHTKVYAVVGFNPSKTYAVPPPRRLSILKKMTRDLPNVECVLVSGLIWRWCGREGVKIMYRGVRTWEEDGREER